MRLPRKYTTFRTTGFDSGYGKAGVATVEIGPEGPTLLALNRVSTTKTAGSKKKATKKAPRRKAGDPPRRKLRVCEDDGNRAWRVELAVIDHIVQFQPRAVAVEYYTVGSSQGGRPNASGWKTVLSVGGILCLGRFLGIDTYEQLPLDIGKLIGMETWEKIDVEDWLRDNLPGFSAAIDEIPKTYREHPSDAAAHALIRARALLQRDLAGEG